MCKEQRVMLGFSEADITPNNPSACDLIGFNRQENRAKGILHPLKSQIMVFTNESSTYCLIAVDSIGFTTELTNLLRDSVAARIKEKRENIMVCFSHTHAAPDAAANNGSYFDFVHKRILSSVDRAIDDLEPVQAVWGIAENTIGVNRRVGADAFDNRIGVLKITSAATNKTKAILLRVTAHANVLTSDNFLISSDYFGVARQLLEQKYGCKVMLTQGAAGNVKPRFRQQNADIIEVNPLEAAKEKIDETAQRRYFEQSMESLRKMATELYRAVDKIYEKLVPVPIYRLDVFSDIEKFYVQLPSMERALEIAAEAKRMAGIDGSDWVAEVNRLHDNQVEYQEMQKEVQYFVVNNGCLCGIADEPMCEIALDIQEKASDDYLFFGGYTNGYEGYLPNSEEYDKGGYEVLWSNLLYFKIFNRVMASSRDTATKLADSISQRWKEFLSTQSNQP